MTAQVIDLQKYRDAKRLRDDPPISLTMWSDVILAAMFPFVTGKDETDERA